MGEVVSGSRNGGEGGRTDSVEVGELLDVREGGEGVVRDDESFERVERFDDRGDLSQSTVAGVEDCTEESE